MKRKTKVVLDALFESIVMFSMGCALLFMAFQLVIFVIG